MRNRIDCGRRSSGLKLAAVIALLGGYVVPGHALGGGFPFTVVTYGEMKASYPFVDNNRYQVFGTGVTVHFVPDDTSLNYGSWTYTLGGNNATAYIGAMQEQNGRLPLMVNFPSVTGQQEICMVNPGGTKFCSNLTDLESDNDKPSITITGPNGHSDSDFTVSFQFSENVVKFDADDVTLTNANKGTFTGVGSTYQLVVTPEAGETITVSVAADVAEDPAQNGNEAAVTFEVRAGSPASEFAAKKENIREVITDYAQRSLNSALAGNTRLTRDARERFLEIRRTNDGDDGSIVSSKNVPFDVDGTFTASGSNLATKGNFFAQSGTNEGTRRQLVFGDFDLQRDDDTGSTTATISGKMTWEKMLSEKTMLGYYMGGEVGRSNIKGSFTGTHDNYGISIGGYFVHALQKNLFVDGFASLGAGRNDLEMANDTLKLESKYSTKTVAVGAAISGSIEQSGYDILPELLVAYGKTSNGDVSFSGTAYGITDDTLSLDAGSVSTATILFRPEFRVPMNEVSGFVSTAMFSFAPRLLCRRVKVTTTTNDCGLGTEISINSTSEDSLSFTNLKLIVDRVGSSTRQSLQYNLEYKF